jgi:glucose-6-phosphate dehydrogenase assembly protein OpcA
MSKDTAALLPAGAEVAFVEVELTLARMVGHRRTTRGPARALTATVVVIGSGARVADAAAALDRLGERGGVRTILISEGGKSEPAVRVTEEAIALIGLAPQFHDNAVAALRLSSLPTVVWWRGGALDALEGVADLADRLVLDVEDPDDVWQRAIAHVERTALTDLRWTRLTRWRALLAHLCDLPDVRSAACAARRLTIEASDVPSARLFAGWLRSSLGWTAAVGIDLRRASGDDASPLESVTISADGMEITLHVRSSRSCLSASVKGVAAGELSRVVPLGDRALNTLISEELGVRARDVAFERALAAALEIRHG